MFKKDLLQLAPLNYRCIREQLHAMKGGYWQHKGDSNSGVNVCLIKSLVITVVPWRVYHALFNAESIQFPCNCPNPVTWTKYTTSSQLFSYVIAGCYSDEFDQIKIQT